ncbi:MAG: carbohydrate deacetylase [Blastocatellia bacterium]
MAEPRKLIVNADDYGRCPEINLAVEQIAATGRLGGVSLLVNGESIQTAIAFLRLHPEVSAGAHLNAIEGLPTSSASAVEILTGRDGTFAGLKTLLQRWALRPASVTRAVETEWRAQIEFLARAGCRLHHLDSHQHTHAFPMAWAIAQKLCLEYGIPGLRLPREIHSQPGRALAGMALRGALATARLTSHRATNGMRHNQHFLGFRRAGAYGFNDLIADLELLPPGLTELALHPSTRDQFPYPKLNGNRERLSLLDNALPAHLQRLGIELSTWERM